MSSGWRRDPSWLAFFATVATAACCLVALARVTRGGPASSAPDTPRDAKQVLILLGLNGPAMLENADQLSAVVEAMRRQGRSKSLELVAADSRAEYKELEASLKRIRPSDLVLIVAPSTSRDVERLAGRFERQFKDVPLLLVSSTAPRTRQRFRDRPHVHFATADNRAIASELAVGVAREPTLSGPLSVCYESQDDAYAVDLAVRTVQELELHTQRRFNSPALQHTTDTTCYEERRDALAGPAEFECTSLLVGTPSWFAKEQSAVTNDQPALPACRDVVLADGLTTAAVERTLRQGAARHVWAIEPVCPLTGEAARGVMFWGRVALPSLLHAFEAVPGGAELSRSLIAERLAQVPQVNFRLRKL
jgi:hypothetical protein